MVESRRLQDKVFDYVNYLILAVVALLMLFPFVYVLLNSFADYGAVRSGFQLLPERWSTKAYELVLSNPAILRSLQNSVFLATVGTVVKLALTTVTAFVLASPKLLGRRFFISLVVLPILFWPGLIPRFLVVKEVGLLNSLWALILPSAIEPFLLLVMVGFFRTLPSELYESAELDGANDWTIFYRIALPLSLPVLAAVGLFYAVELWNMYFPAILYITDPSKWPLQVIMRQTVILGQANDVADAAIDVPSYALQMATIIVSTLPIILVYPFLQRFFLSGRLTGALKG